ncbi:pyridoxamine 5'-phosphate oxidase family protein [Collinsella vaginalis]|uniref:pyridoxamine 5'-phosphate oxidase family protein n=1 Tax=Collinsella vaginalis TaxID=1870987 RepID=UPI0015C51530|nr:pyridoxamine 5'-phosphate oxidase family protein [Collinsella vaginalis]
MRAMRLAKREITDSEELKSVVEACQVLRLGLLDDDGVYIVPVNFGIDWRVDAEGRPAPAFWLHSAGEGRKADALRASSVAGARIAVEMDIDDGVIAGAYACSYSLAFRSVMGLGIAHEVTDPAEKEHGLARIMEHAAPGAPVTFTEQALERVGVWRIDVVELTGKQRKAR